MRTLYLAIWKVVRTFMSHGTKFKDGHLTILEKPCIRLTYIMLYFYTYVKLDRQHEPFQRTCHYFRNRTQKCFYK